VLHLTGERVYSVPPLSIPDDEVSATDDEILTSDAVQLFITRARERGAEVPLTPGAIRAIGAICRRLDGLPLAIELAAPWLRALPPQALLDRLDRRLPMLESGPRNAPERQRTMRATIEWSYVLLSPEEQQLLRRLSVFIGGFTLAAIDPVTGLGSSTSGTISPDSIALLGALVDHSLVRRLPPSLGRPSDDPRYFMFATIREFGLAQLREAGELGAIRWRHAGWCIALAETAARERVGRAPSHTADQLAPERHNVRAAFEWLEMNERIDDALGLAADLWPLWLEHGEMTEGRRHLARLLARANASTDRAPGSRPAGRGHALPGAGRPGDRPSPQPRGPLRFRGAWRRPRRRRRPHHAGAHQHGPG
jgi:predicted ATPase